MGKVNKTLARASLFIFVSRSLQPSSSFLFLWQKQSDSNNCFSAADGRVRTENYERPCFSPEFISNIRLVSAVVFIIGTGIYNKYLSHWSYRRIWTCTQILLCMFGFLDVIWVLRYNRYVGIPDTFFALGDKVLVELVDRLNRMPMYVLAATLCPEGLEATIFAVNMGLSNLGWGMRYV